MAQPECNAPLPTPLPINPVVQNNPITSGELPPSGQIQSPPTDVPVGVKRLHVTNLPFRINETDLGEMFGVSAIN